MIKVECHSGYQLKEKPIAFQFCNRRYKVKEVVDRWYGEGAVYFKVYAEDNNIYLLKYEEGQDFWDLIFYQNPLKVEAVMASHEGIDSIELFGFKPFKGRKNNIMSRHSH